MAGGAVGAAVAVTSGINLCRVGVGAAVAAGAGACVAAGAGRCVAAGAGGCVAAGAAVGAIVGAAVGAGAAGAAVAAGAGVAASSSSSPPHATITSKSPPIRASIASTFQVADRHPLVINTPNLCLLLGNARLKALTASYRKGICVSTSEKCDETDCRDHWETPPQTSICLLITIFVIAFLSRLKSQKSLQM